MPRLTRVERLVRILQQMQDTLQTRTPIPIPPPADLNAAHVVRQRRRIEWQCDYDIECVMFAHFVSVLLTL